MTFTTESMKKRIATLRDVRSELSQVPGLSFQDLDDAIQRTQRNDSLIAVFGAFSAGKSSLLNALLGEPLLTVSPNPTTASVTQIRSATNDMREIQVTAKTEEELWSDVENAFHSLHLKPQNLQSGIEMVGQLDAKSYPTALRRHIRFLKATSEGFETMQHRLGNTWRATVDDLQSFSADERYAAYVARVDVYANHPSLARGFVFVDTPGVDSIHRRHTDVAFRYMRHADAVLFVMYYTHAFTQGDRDFLLQLAGVQDVAATNKLFSVINAVDLAKSDDERQAVRGRVESELGRLGVRFPRVYEISAQLAQAARRLESNLDDETAIAMVKARLDASRADGWTATPETIQSLHVESGLPGLEADLTTYVTESGDKLVDDLVKRTLVQLATQVDERIANERMRQMTGDAEKKSRRNRMIELRDQLQRQVDSLATDDESATRSQLRRELDELEFHAGERIRLRYRDLFRLSFQPGRFRTGRTSEKLREAGEEFADALARQIAIETRTYSLRAQSLIQRQLEWSAQEWNERLVLEKISPLSISLDITEQVVVETVRSELPESIMRPFYRHFSSAKQFFEQGGQKSMMNESESAVMDSVRIELERVVEDIKFTALSSMTKALSDMCATCRDRLNAVLNAASLPFEASTLHNLEKAKQYLESL